MARLIDLSHPLDASTPRIRMTLPTGETRQGGLDVEVLVSRQESASIHKGEASFQMVRVSFPGPTGTYMDSPFCRWPERRDIGQLTLDELILPGVVVDARGLVAGQALEELPQPVDVQGAAVLFNFGWDRLWGQPEYRRWPHVAPALADRLLAAGARLFGFDTPSADGNGVSSHPVHSNALARDVPIVENLRGLDALHGQRFRFFAIPLAVRGATSMPLRAFAEV